MRIKVVDATQSEERQSLGTEARWIATPRIRARAIGRRSNRDWRGISRILETLEGGCCVTDDSKPDMNVNWPLAFPPDVEANPGLATDDRTF